MYTCYTVIVVMIISLIVSWIIICDLHPPKFSSSTLTFSDKQNCLDCWIVHSYPNFSMVSTV